MNHTVVAYLIYLPVAVAMTIWVARTLHKNGRVFLVQAFRGKEDMADSVNHLLVVGFYLINVGFIVAALRYGDKPHDVQETIEFLSTKLGIVLLVLGGMHFFNLFNFDKMRKKGLRPEGTHAEPPLVNPSKTF
jgi:cytochrome c biogenesis protein CcdA